ncbi:MCP four helix bundle domain-containing protein [Bradyrhizobium diazoefficiens]|nr:methyl-accepting chemotaxis protein [Bradyrhizobium diazoefficiens]UCF54014.1 MAG: MCP four helix bundle domain-containing protein [Bradyrhizobium sp.]MBR0967679.1 MCP four helix bundle domain-containing protein [Bradyrhizobium diazoefficiens]MBR0981073.1 MCP four helix bundle domain-containing protein [Bradyrhizobium diazoefficiens]MBR1010550.1 MCP four helix bundle domain-containing protein [Bradyrhizobium diazoefficiens]MBR1017206.1 MCP four helix bundle domain-containing protein [Bradyr
MSKLSIRFKILTVLSVLVLALAGVGVMAIGTMRNINAHTVEIAESWLPSVRALGAIRGDVNELRVALRLHLMQDSAEGKEAAEKRIASLRERIEKTRKVYEPLITSPEERALYEQWATAWGDYLNGAQEVLALSRKITGRFPTEANELLQTKVSKIAQAADPLLVKDIELNNQGAEAETKQAADSYATIFRLLVGIIVVSVLIAIGAAYYLVRDVSSGIASIIHPMQALGQGELSAEVPHRGERTEIGSMADALQIFKEALIAKKAADEAAAADAEAKIERGRRVDAITRNFEAMIGEVVGTVSAASTELEASATTLTGTAQRGQELATVVAAASEEASTNVQAVAAASEELSSSITEISRRVQDSARMAAEAVQQAARTNDRVNALSQAASRIGDVVELINTIAGQTNLLALNATIEAARAGEAGRGFAVVASEVKALAEQTAKATGEIGQQVSGIQAATQESVSAIQEIGGTIERLSEVSSAIAAAVEEQGAATQEISRNVQQASAGTQEVSSNITDVQRGAIETGEASSEVLSAAKSLAGDSTRLKVEVAQFLEAVRAA